MRFIYPTLVAAASAAVLVGSASAQSNLERMMNVQTTGTSFAAQFIDQTGPKADQIKKNLERIKLPAGFKISLYAIVPDARHMAVAPQGTTMFVGTRKVNVYTVTDRDRDRVADEVEPFAPPLDWKVPNAVCFSKDGFLFTVEANRVLVFPPVE